MKGSLKFFVTMADGAREFLQNKRHEREQVIEEIREFDLWMHRKRAPLLHKLQTVEAAIITSKQDLLEKKEIVRDMLDDKDFLDE